MFLIAFVVALVIFGATDTGQIIFDTKLGVDLNAAEFLQRLWTLWNPLEWFGSLQDQYIGYAIPMAPFFLIGQLCHVPIWLIERLWLALLIAVGFTGMVKLARALGIGSNSSRLLAGTVFALWPTFTIAIGSTSAAALPGMVVPWALLPLIASVHGRTTPGRAAARSGLAIAAMAGVNAASTLAVLLLPALYILTHAKARQRIELGLKWGIAVIAATAWWLIPLLLQARYSFNFLPYIEQSATTSRTMSAAAVLRGMGTWTAYFNLGGTPWLTAGWAMVNSPAAMLASAAASGVGLAGLARRDMPARRWLGTCVGLVAIVALAGYYGPLSGPFHAHVNNLLDGPLAPFRSMYKLEPVIAVPLALGCAHVIDQCWRLSIPIGRSRRLQATALMAPLVALVLAGLALPQLTGQVLQAGSFTSVPGYWYKAAAFLAVHSPRQTALVVPANPHGQYTWGDTIDDALEPLAASPWAARAVVPYGGPGSQLLLATAEQAIESGQRVPGLAPYLARAGVRYVVVRNDTAPSATGYTPPQVVNETLVQSGFRRVASFGPKVTAAPGYPNIPGLTPGFVPNYPSIEIFEASSPVDRAVSPVAALPLNATTLVDGGPDSLLQLTGQGILTSQPAVISGQKLSGTPALWAVTDGQRRADTNFGATYNYQSFTYTANESNPVDSALGGGGGPPRQLLPVAAAGHQTVAVLSGAASVTASSYGNWLGESPQYDPVNAFDRNQATAWMEGNPLTPVGQWIQINFGRSIALPSRVGVQLLDSFYGQAIANELRVTTSAGSASTDVVGSSDVQPLRVPTGPSKWLRITITGASNVVPGQIGAGISDVLIPGVKVTRFLKPAEDAAGAKAPVEVFSFNQPVSSPFNQDGKANVFSANAQELDRVFHTPRTATFSTGITAVPDPGPALEGLISQLSPAGTASKFQVTASSIWDALPEFGPDNLFQPRTGRPWLSSGDDAHPSLELTWQGRRTIRKIVLKPAYGLATAPTGVLIESPAGYRLLNVGLGGIVKVSPPLRTDKMKLIFSVASSNAAGVTSNGQPAQLPAGLASVGIPGLRGVTVAAPTASTSFQLACGSGPALMLNGTAYQTSVSGTVGDLIQLRPVKLGLCTPGGTLTLAAGSHNLVARPSGAFTVTDLSLRSQPSVSVQARSRTIKVVDWGSDNRSVRIGPGAASYLEIHENANAGWAATLMGRKLTPATLDGWQQAFLVPAGRGGTITLTYQPSTIYHDGIIASAIALLVMMGIAGKGRLRVRRSGLRPDGPGPAERDHVTGFSDRPNPVSWRRALVRSIPVAFVVFATGGLIAIVVPVLAAINNWRVRWLPAIAACAMFGAGAVAAAARTPNALGSGALSGPAQVFALVALAAALMPAISAEPVGSAQSDAEPKTTMATVRPAGARNNGALRPFNTASEALPRHPFTVPDEMACHFDSKAEPFNIHLEMRIPGRLDRKAFHTAAVEGLIASPHASARRARHSMMTASYFWEHLGTLDRDPITYIDVADEAALARERTAFISRSPSVDLSPPVSLLVASGPDYDHVILNGHHAPMDALSWLDLLRDIGRRYRAAQIKAGGVGFDLQPALSAKARQHERQGSSPASIRLPSSARTPQRQHRSTRPARIAKDGNTRRGYGVHLMLLPDIPAVRPFSTGHKATLNDALVTALIAAIGRWNAAHGRPARLIRITTPFNARNPGDISAPGNLTRLVTIAAAPPAAVEDLVPLLLDVAHQARRARHHRSQQVGTGTRLLAALRCPAVLKRLAVHAALRTAGPLICDTAMLTNLGNVPDPPDFGIRAVMSMAFSAQAQMPRGLSVGAITVGGQLQLALRYSRALFNDEASQLFGTTFLTALSEITTSLASDGRPPGPASP